MLDTINKEKYEIVEFPPFKYCINLINKECYKLISDKIEYDWREIIYTNNNNYLKILIYKDDSKEWFNIYKYKVEKYKYFKLEFLFYNPNNHEFSYKYNRIIRCASHQIDGDFTKLFEAQYFYNNNEMSIEDCISRKRKISNLDAKKIIIPDMNLMEIIYRAEEAMLDFYEVIDEKNGEVKTLKLFKEVDKDEI